MLWLLSILTCIFLWALVLAASFTLCHSPECLGTMKSTLNHRVLVRLLMTKSKQQAPSPPVKPDGMAGVNGGRLKMILAVRTDLSMTKGKTAAQCCHAVLGAYKKAPKGALAEWEVEGQPKVVVKVKTEEELLHLRLKAREKGLTTYLVQDAGRTQVAPNSLTVLAIGPASIPNIDEVSGHLKLL